MVNLLDNAFFYRAALNTVKFRKVSLTPPEWCPERRMETFVVRDGSLVSEQG